MRPKPPLASPGMRIGVMGGSFNPAHQGHRQISVAALARLGLDRLWWVVTPGNPLKGAADLADLAERIRQARRVAAHPRIDVTGFEAALPTAYTAETVAYLKRRFPGVHFVWVMGGDNLAQFSRWRDWRRIFSLMPIAVLDRPGARHKALASPASLGFAAFKRPESQSRRLPLAAPPAWAYLTIPLSEASSTELRKARELHS